MQKKGILKNPNTHHEKHHIQWDEHEIAEYDKERGHHTKIDEPKTPYNYYNESDDEDMKSQMEDMNKYLNKDHAEGEPHPIEQKIQEHREKTEKLHDEKPHTEEEHKHSTPEKHQMNDLEEEDHHLSPEEEEKKKQEFKEKAKQHYKNEFRASKLLAQGDLFIE